MKQATHSVNIGKGYAVGKAAFLLSKPVNFSQSTEIGRRDMSEQIEKRVENLELDVAQLKTDVSVIKSNYATKADIESVKALVHNEISSVKSIIHNEISSVKNIIHQEITTVNKEMSLMRKEISSIHKEIASGHKNTAAIHKEISLIYKKMADQTKWMVTMMFGFSGIVIAAMKFMI
ncbi:hypothetical protein [Xenorhabdus bovienii]|uniref:hypothetical protein n=1 Tax=Xenorhabdus bovienii TaxID=40576 RepID=UPI00237CFF40|nr:hypothetical protein [Xenorhabdus bovienii]